MQWSVRQVLDWTRSDLAKRGIESARLDAELLVADALGAQRIQLYLDLDRPLTSDELTAVRQRVERRRRREPVAYILGKRDFYGRTFEVDGTVLIPRPDTETLIGRALELMNGDPAPVADVCTGSGCIALTLAAERPQWCVIASDVSAPALAVARRNAQRLGVESRVTFAEGDLFAALAEPSPSSRFALITLNPPYLSDAEIGQCMPEVRDHEPRQALVAGSRGDEILERIAIEAPAYLSPGGSLLVEVGYSQAGPFASRLSALESWTEVTTHRDLGGVHRVVEARRA